MNLTLAIEFRKLTLIVDEMRLDLQNAPVRLLHITRNSQAATKPPFQSDRLFRALCGRSHEFYKGLVKKVSIEVSKGLALTLTIRGAPASCEQLPSV